MDRKQKTLDLLIGQRVLPLFHHPDAEVSIQVLRALYRGGARVVEYTNSSEHAINNFLQLRKVVDKELPDLQLGAGVIRNKIEATEFINEGARFIVCPGVVEAVASLAELNNSLWIPGCMTATELILADDLGAQLVKLFPANLLGPAYLAAMKEIFPGLFFMATGGIEASKENLENWFKSGAHVVGIGNNLITDHLLATRDYHGIEAAMRQSLQFAKEINTR